MFRSPIFLALAAMATARHCTNISVPISISSRNAVFDMPPPATDIEVTNIFLDMSRPGINTTSQYVKGYTTVTGDYTLAATYCEPDNGPGHTLQILTHGVGFDRSYWDLPFNSYNYSYVARALDAGYSTLTWDRLGIGRSSHGDPVNEIQVFLETAALFELTEQARNGVLDGIAHQFGRTVHIGHSFGSVMTYALSAMYPNATSGIVLTGFSQVPRFMAYFALGGHFAPVKENEELADQYAVGYIAPRDNIGIHINFLGPGDFDPKMLEDATVSGQAAAVGELLTVASGPPSSAFAGPVMIITGDRDVPFCGGNCMDNTSINGAAPNLIEYSRGSFESASVFNATIIPKAGHNLNYGYTAPTTFRAITEFLNSNL